jgi:ABC-type molybdate transport system substrate-binding protein
MRKMLAVFLLLIGTTSIAAAQVNTLATMAVEGPLRALEREYQQPGQPVHVTFDTSPNITKRLASGEMPDVLIAQTSTIDEMIKDAKRLATAAHRSARLRSAWR